MRSQTYYLKFFRCKHIALDIYNETSYASFALNLELYHAGTVHLINGIQVDRSYSLNRRAFSYRIIGLRIIGITFITIARTPIVADHLFNYSNFSFTINMLYAGIDFKQLHLSTTRYRRIFRRPIIIYYMKMITRLYIFISLRNFILITVNSAHKVSCKSCPPITMGKISMPALVLIKKETYSITNSSINLDAGIITHVSL